MQLRSTRGLASRLRGSRSPSARLGQGAERGPVTLRLNSFMDILTILLLFLLKSFVAEGESVTPTPGVSLPYSAGRDTPPVSIVVGISNDAILLGGQTVSRISDLRASDGLIIAPLAAALEQVRVQQAEQAQLRGEDLALRPVSIQGDRDMEFMLLERIMATLAESGYETVSLAVVEAS